MNQLTYFIRNIKSNWKLASLKILTLGIGLTLGLLLLAKVFFDHSYDHFYPDLARIYMLEQVYESETEPSLARVGIPGAVAPGMQAEVAGVEVATRFTGVGRRLFSLEGGEELSGEVILADSCLFEVLPRPLLEGEGPKEALAQPNQVLVSASVARKLGGDVLGKELFFKHQPQVPLVIRGVFRDLPYNSSIKYDVLVSMPSIKLFTGDGSNNWLGNDRYQGFVKLAPGVEPSSLAPAIRAMQEKYQDMEYFRKYKKELRYNLLPLERYYTSQEQVQQRSLMLVLLALALLFICIVNYVMLTTLSVASKAKEIALHKCYGASKKQLIRLVYQETLVYILLSLLLFGSLLFAFRAPIDEFLGEQVALFFSLRTGLLLLLVCVVIFVLTGVLPAHFYLRTPILKAIQIHQKQNRTWKQALLFVQFVAVMTLLSFLLQIKRQYQGVLQEDVGYTYENLLYGSFPLTSQEQGQTLLHELSRLACVEEVSSTSTLLFDFASGNNIRLPQGEQDLFNIADLYTAQANYLEFLGVPLVEGSYFDEESSANEILVSADFVNKLAQFTDLSTGIVGREVYVTEHGLCRIRGVYERIQIRSVEYPDSRATILFCTPKPSTYFLVKLKELSPASKAEVDACIRDILGNSRQETLIYSQTYEGLYAQTLKFGQLISLGGLIAFIFSVVGLVSYTQSEIKRRSKEIAIRKINGASFQDLLFLLTRSVLYLAIPALFLGGGLAYLLAHSWMQNYAVQYYLSLGHYLAVALFVLALLLLLTYGQLRVIARMNPVDSLQAE